IACEPHNLVFTGSMDWLPNEDAIQFFTREVLPRVKQAIPDVTLTVVGRNPFPSLIELGRRDPSIVVTGRVEDVRPYMEKAAAFAEICERTVRASGQWSAVSGQLPVEKAVPTDH